MCLLIKDKIAMYGFSPGLFFFFCAGVSSSVILFICGGRTMETMGTKTKNKRKKIKHTRSKCTRQTCACTATVLFEDQKQGCPALQAVFVLLPHFPTSVIRTFDPIIAGTILDHSISSSLHPKKTTALGWRLMSSSTFGRVWCHW